MPRNVSGLPSGDLNRVPPEYYFANKNTAYRRKSGISNMDVIPYAAQALLSRIQH
jgi:hypothetical protein